MKRKISYEQNEALAAGRSIARSNQRRRVAQNQRLEKELAAIEESRAKEQARIREMLNGFYYGDRVESFDLCWRQTRVGTLVDTDPYGAWIKTDDGQVHEVNRYALKEVNA